MSLETQENQIFWPDIPDLGWDILGVPEKFEKIYFVVNLWLANPFSPYSIQKRPEPQICPKFVPVIVFGGSNQGDWNLAKICQNLKNGNFRTNFGNFLTNFSPPDWNRQKQSPGQIWDKFGVRGFFECCKGKKGSQFWPPKKLNNLARLFFVIDFKGILGGSFEHSSWDQQNHRPLNGPFYRGRFPPWRGCPKTAH